MNQFTEKLSSSFSVLVCLLLLTTCQQDDAESHLLKHNSHDIVTADNDPILNDYLNQMKSSPNSRTSVIDNLNFDQAVKRTDSTGRTVYSMHLESYDSLTIKNVWLYENNGGFTGRIIAHEFDREWLLDNHSDNQWENFTGWFSVYDLDEELLYTTRMIDGQAVEESDDGGRASGYVCTTRTTRICSSVPSMPELGRHCYYDTETSCTWFNSDYRPHSSGALFGGSSTSPYDIADYERRAATTCNSGYTWTSTGCVSNKIIEARNALSKIQQLGYKITAAEQRLVNQNPVKATAVFLSYKDAWSTTITYFGSNKANDCSDAFRHAIWNALATQRAGESFTRNFTTAHESEVSTNEKLAKEMDLFNNHVGRAIGKNYPNQNHPIQLASIVKDEYLSKGKLRMFDDPSTFNTHLINTSTCK